MIEKDSWAVGDFVVVAGVSGTIKEFTLYGKRVVVEHRDNDNKPYPRVYGVDDLPPYPRSPKPDDVVKVVKARLFVAGQRVKLGRDLPHDVYPLSKDDEGVVTEGLGGIQAFKSERYGVAHLDDYSVDGVKRSPLDFCEVLSLAPNPISTPSPAAVDAEKKTPSQPPPNSGEEQSTPEVDEWAAAKKKYEAEVRFGVCPVCGNKAELRGGICMSCNEKAANGELKEASVSPVEAPKLVRGAVLHHKAANFNLVITGVEGYTLSVQGTGKRYQWDAAVWEIVPPTEAVMATLLTVIESQIGRITLLEETLKEREARLNSQAVTLGAMQKKMPVVADGDGEIARLREALAAAEDKVDSLKKKNEQQSELLKQATLSKQTSPPAPSAAKPLEARIAALEETVQGLMRMMPQNLQEVG